jgi:hypothetical protein
MRRWKERIWPTINDQRSASRAVERAVRITTIWAVVNAAIGLVSILSKSRITDRNPVEWDGMVLDSGGSSISGLVFLFLGVLFGVVAWKIRSMSRNWALGGLVLAAIMLFSDLATFPSPIALVLHAIVLLYFIHAVRAAVVFERCQSEQPVGYQIR